MPYMPSEPLVELCFEADQVLVIQSEVVWTKPYFVFFLPKSPLMCGQCDLKICSVQTTLVGPIEDTDPIGQFLVVS